MRRSLLALLIAGCSGEQEEQPVEEVKEVKKVNYCNESPFNSVVDSIFLPETKEDKEDGLKITEVSLVQLLDGSRSPLGLEVTVSGNDVSGSKLIIDYGNDRRHNEALVEPCSAETWDREYNRFSDTRSNITNVDIVYRLEPDDLTGAQMTLSVMDGDRNVHGSVELYVKDRSLGLIEYDQMAPEIVGVYNFEFKVTYTRDGEFEDGDWKNTLTVIVKDDCEASNLHWTIDEDDPCQGTDVTLLANSRAHELFPYFVDTESGETLYGLDRTPPYGGIPTMDMSAEHISGEFVVQAEDKAGNVSELFLGNIDDLKYHGGEYTIERNEK